MEAIAKALFGINTVPAAEQAKMIKRAAKAGRNAVTEELRNLQESVNALKSCENCDGHDEKYCYRFGCKNYNLWRLKK